MEATHTGVALINTHIAVKMEGAFRNDAGHVVAPGAAMGSKDCFQAQLPQLRAGTACDVISAVVHTGLQSHANPEINEAEDTHTGLEPQAHPQINETRNTRRRGRNGKQGIPAGA